MLLNNVRLCCPTLFAANCYKSPEILQERQGSIQSSTHHGPPNPLNCTWVITSSVGERVIIRYSLLTWYKLDLYPDVLVSAHSATEFNLGRRHRNSKWKVLLTAFQTRGLESQKRTWSNKETPASSVTCCSQYSAKCIVSDSFYLRFCR